MNKTEREKWIERLEDERFLNTMFERYLIRTGRWDSQWREIIGSRMHYREIEWDPKYDTIGEDFVELFITTNDDKIERTVILLSEFVKWNEKRMNE